MRAWISCEKVVLYGGRCELKCAYILFGWWKSRLPVPWIVYGFFFHCSWWHFYISPPVMMIPSSSAWRFFWEGLSLNRVGFGLEFYIAIRWYNFILPRWYRWLVCRFCVQWIIFYMRLYSLLHIWACFFFVYSRFWEADCGLSLSSMIIEGFSHEFVYEVFMIVLNFGSYFHSCNGTSPCEFSLLLHSCVPPLYCFEHSHQLHKDINCSHYSCMCALVESKIRHGFGEACFECYFLS